MSVTERKEQLCVRPRVAPLAARPAPTLSTSSFAVRFFVLPLRKAKRFVLTKRLHPRLSSNPRYPPKQKSTTRVLFVLEQATRVELAGNSLGSCRHTARRHLLIFLYYIRFLENCQHFFVAFQYFVKKFPPQKIAGQVSSNTCPVHFYF